MSVGHVALWDTRATVSTGSNNSMIPEERWLSKKLVVVSLFMPTALSSRLKKLLFRWLLIIRLLGKFVYAMSFARKECLYRQVEFAQYGSDMTWKHLKNDWML